MAKKRKNKQQGSAVEPTSPPEDKQQRSAVELTSPPKDKQQAGDIAIPENFFCPLSGILLIDPVILSDGQICERSEIDNLLKSKKTISSETREALGDKKNVTPDHELRVQIRDWCKEHKKSDLIHYDLMQPEYVRNEYFESLHKKLASENLEDKKEAAKDLRIETTKWPYFRSLYAKSPDAISKLVAPLSQYEGGPQMNLELEDDLVATLMNISAVVEVEKLIAESVNGILVLVQALNSESPETQRNATLAIYRISGFLVSREIIYGTDAIKYLARMLVGNSRKLLIDDVRPTLFRLFRSKDIKLKAVKDFADEGIFKKMEDTEFLGTLLPLLVSLSRLQEGLIEVEKYDCKPLFRVLRESHSADDRKYGSQLLLAVLRKDGSRWKKMILEEETFNGTITEISEIGTSNAKKTATEILNLLKSI